MSDLIVGHAKNARLAVRLVDERDAHPGMPLAYGRAVRRS
jgi:hypothetical protein